MFTRRESPIKTVSDYLGFLLIGEAGVVSNTLAKSFKQLRVIFLGNPFTLGLGSGLAGPGFCYEFGKRFFAFFRSGASDRTALVVSEVGTGGRH